MRPHKNLILAFSPVALCAATFSSGCKTVDCSPVSVDTEQHSNIAVIDLAGLSIDEVEYTIDDDEESVTRTPESTGLATLFGLPPLSDIAYSLRSEGEVVCEGVFTTGNLPAELPTITVTVLDESAISSEQIFLGVAIGQDASYPFAIDRQGRWRWYRNDVALERIDQVEGSRFGTGVVIADEDAEIPGSVDKHITLRNETLLTESIEDFSLDGAHHFFAQQGEGVVGYISVDVRTWTSPNEETFEVVGDRLMEYDNG